jgi:hypothetical protein
MACAIIGQVDTRTQHQWPVQGAFKVHRLEQAEGGEGAFFVGRAGRRGNAGLAYAVSAASGVERLRAQAVCRGRWDWEGTLWG